MRVGLIIAGAIVLVALILFGWWRTTYNNFVNLDESVKAQLGQLNNVYQQRSDLIPNLVETVKGSAVNERETLTDVITARSKATGVQLTADALKDPQAFANFQRVQGDLSNALSHLMVVSEQYPQLKSQQNFTVLLDQIEGQERRIQVERQRYNEIVRDYNQKIRSFPSSMIASMSGFTQYPYFEAAAGAENAPKVNFGNPEAAPNSGAGSNVPSNGGTTPQNAPANNAAPSPSSQPHGPVRPSH